MEPTIELSAVSQSLIAAGARTPQEALPIELMHNLRYQHNWSDLRMYAIVATANPPIIDVTMSPFSALPPASDRVYLISGLPPRHSYIHPDLLNHLVKYGINEIDVPIQREWVLPMSTGEKWSLARFCYVFDALPKRNPIKVTPGFIHQDVKRILCGIKSHDGLGGDGTIVYYVMQDGDVKPRQN